MKAYLLQLRMNQGLASNSNNYWVKFVLLLVHTINFGVLLCILTRSEYSEYSEYYCHHCIDPPISMHHKEKNQLQLQHYLQTDE